MRPKYRHYKPKDLVVVRLNGRDFYLGKYGSPESHELYHRLVAEWLAHGQNLPADFRLDDLVDRVPPVDQPQSPVSGNAETGSGQRSTN